MRHENDKLLFHRIDPEGGAGRTAPGKFTRRAENLRLGRVEHHRDAQAETNAVVGRFAKDRHPHAAEVAIVGHVVGGHQRHCFATEKSHAVEFALVEQHLGKAEVVGASGDQPAATGTEGRRLQIGTGGWIIDQAKTAFVKAIVGRKATLFGRRDKKGGVYHAQRLQNLFGKIAVERLAGKLFNQIAKNIGRQAVIPACPRGKEQRQIAQFGDHLSQAAG